MNKYIYHGDIINGTGVIELTSAQYNANKAYYDSLANIIKITDRDPVVQTDDIGDLFTKLKVRCATGRNLGTSYTATQQAEVAAGTFNGMAVGDYWVINGVNWRIWDMDYYYNWGNPQLTTHHLVILPDTALLTDTTVQYMYTSSTPSGGYQGTLYRSTYKSQCETIVGNAFGSSHILSYTDLLSNYPSTWSVATCTVELPTGVMIWGSNVSLETVNPNIYPWSLGYSNRQLLLSSLVGNFIPLGTEGVFLRDLNTDASGSSYFWSVIGYRGNSGTCATNGTGYTIRPYFLLC